MASTSPNPKPLRPTTPAALPPSLTPTWPRKNSARRRAAAGLLGLLLVLLAPLRPALAQIRPDKPGRIRADNRRAQRENRRTDLPYHDTHLDRSKRQLKRGEGDQPHPEGSDAYYYKKGNSPSESDRNVWGLRRKKNKPKE